VEPQCAKRVWRLLYAVKQHHLEIASAFKLTRGKNPAKVPVVGVF